MLYLADVSSGQYLAVLYQANSVYMYYDTGFGTLSTGSVQASLTSGQWVKISVYRDIDRNWYLKVGDQQKQIFNQYKSELSFKFISLGDFPEANLLSDYYQNQVSQYEGFRGCMDDLLIARGNEVYDLRLFRSESSDMCSEAYNPCLDTKCQNGATCEQTACAQIGRCFQGDDLYRCACSSGYTGRDCELSVG